FEPATSRTPSVRATRLRHVPTAYREIQRITCVREGSRSREVPRGDRAGLFGVLWKSEADAAKRRRKAANAVDRRSHSGRLRRLVVQPDSLRDACARPRE